ncbi:MAG: hypothetical protein MR608_02540 [Clostridiales bacterium]|nr:hypothetical protein [Clostridiales bacterium]
MESTYERPAAAPATTTDMSVGAWIGTLILTCIPIVNLICLIVWAVSSSPEKRSRKNWAIAQFVVILIGIVLSVFLYSVIGVSLLSVLSSVY